ncbi:MAG: hypothetical protein ACREAG_00740 [Nitrosopumilaceae archaeon]
MLSNYTFGALLILFLIFITVKGSLGNYLTLLVYVPPKNENSPPPGGVQGGVVPGTMPFLPSTPSPRSL